MRCCHVLVVEASAAMFRCAAAMFQDARWYACCNMSQASGYACTPSLTCLTFGRWSRRGGGTQEHRFAPVSYGCCACAVTTHEHEQLGRIKMRFKRPFGPLAGVNTSASKPWRRLHLLPTHHTWHGSATQRRARKKEQRHKIGDMS